MRARRGSRMQCRRRSTLRPPSSQAGPDRATSAGHPTWPNPPIGYPVDPRDPNRHDHCDRYHTGCGPRVRRILRRCACGCGKGRALWINAGETETAIDITVGFRCVWVGGWGFAAHLNLRRLCIALRVEAHRIYHEVRWVVVRSLRPGVCACACVLARACDCACGRMCMCVRASRRACVRVGARACACVCVHRGLAWGSGAAPTRAAGLGTMTGS